MQDSYYLCPHDLTIISKKSLKLVSNLFVRRLSMKLVIKTVITLLLLEISFYSSVSLASKYPNQVLRTSPSNYAATDESIAKNGPEYCSLNKIWKTCVPIKNVGNDEIYVDFNDDNGKSGNVSQDLSGEIVVDANFDETRDDIVKVVDFKNRNKLIYEGKVKNKTGLLCNEQGCKDWSPNIDKVTIWLSGGSVLHADYQYYDSEGHISNHHHYITQRTLTHKTIYPADGTDISIWGEWGKKPKHFTAKKGMKIKCGGATVWQFKCHS